MSSLLIVGLFFLLPALATAQETDTTRQELNLEPEQERPLQQPEFDRPGSGGIMTEMGSYQVPEETQYYQPPFKGQEYLDMAVEAYREELEKRMGNNWFWKFLDVVSPYINNQFEFGVYQIYDQPVVDRDNPLFKSYQNNEKLD
ncbi:hypothetical protein [Fodinibius salsisoli]|uniref:Uncharacterized protein n=1 Tax=Fodinibius salsisoli TaxID=2820877 RepID=A0ABT3PL13_9BACT|nr:hypothetical protein [Fodinibius salsisoli]MCW9706616.1 hypothetical protein [Fodinibius salsisoli]